MKTLRLLPVALLWIVSLALTFIGSRALAPSRGTSSPAATTALPAMASRGTASGTPESSGMSPTDGMPERVKETLHNPDPLTRISGIAALAPRLDAENALPVLGEFRRLRGSGESGLAAESELLLLHVGRAAGRAALEQGRPRDLFSPNFPADSGLLMRGYAGGQAQAALGYWKSLADGPYKTSLKSGLLAGLADTDTGLARDFFDSLSPQEQLGEIDNLSRQIERRDGRDALLGWFEGLEGKAGDPTVKWTAFHAVADQLQLDPAGNAPFMTRQAAEPWAASDIYNRYAVAYTDGQPVAALEWAVALPAPEGSQIRRDTLQSVVSRWTADDAGGVGDWLNSHPGSPHYDEIAASYALQMSVIDPAAAVRWNRTIQDVALRTVIAGRIGSTAEGAP